MRAGARQAVGKCDGSRFASRQSVEVLARVKRERPVRIEHQRTLGDIGDERHGRAFIYSVISRDVAGHGAAFGHVEEIGHRHDVVLGGRVRARIRRVALDAVHDQHDLLDAVHAQVQRGEVEIAAPHESVGARIGRDEVEIGGDVVRELLAFELLGREAQLQRVDVATARIVAESRAVDGRVEDQQIVAIAAEQGVPARTADQCVVAIAPEQAVRTAATLQHVLAIAAEELVIASTAEQRVRAAAAIKQVATRSAVHEVIAIPRKDDVCACARIDRVAPPSGEDDVVAAKCVDGVGTIAAKHDVPALETVIDVVQIRAEIQACEPSHATIPMSCSGDGSVCSASRIYSLSPPCGQPPSQPR